VSELIGTPLHSSRAKLERAAKLRHVLDAIDSSALVVAGVDPDGVEHTAERVRADLVEKLRLDPDRSEVGLEEGGR
jgi:murein tripeptide amidase MpaA